MGLTWRLLCYVICSIISMNGVTTYQEREVIENIQVVCEEQEIEEVFLFQKPIEGGIVTSNYGKRNGRMHKGIDLADKSGTEIYASESGEVITACYSGNYGNLVIIDHKNGYVSYYAHCSKILVNKGDLVTKGYLIAKMRENRECNGLTCSF